MKKTNLNSYEILPAVKNDSNQAMSICHEASSPNVSSFGDALCGIANIIANVKMNRDNIQLEIHKIDKQFDAFKAQLDADMIKYKENSTMTREVIKRTQDLIDKTLDKILSVDISNESQMKTIEHLTTILLQLNSDLTNRLLSLL